MTTPTTFAASAPARIDLAGGTVDIWPICQVERNAATVNLAIDLRATATVRWRDDGRYVLDAADHGTREEHDSIESVLASEGLPLLRELVLHAAPDHGVELTTKSGVPSGSGLGGSSTLAVAALSALARARDLSLPPDELLRRAINVETRVIAVPTGAQDYLSAIHGGLGVITYPVEGPRRDPIDVELEAIEERLVLVYTGKPHYSATNNWEITKAYVDGDATVRRLMHAIACSATLLADALAGGRLDAAATAIAAEWEARQKLAPGVTTERIDALGRVAQRSGATAMKVCGAGGGGCVFFWCGAGTRTAVSDALRAAGAEILPFRAAREGVR